MERETFWKFGPTQRLVIFITGREGCRSRDYNSKRPLMGGGDTPPLLQAFVHRELSDWHVHH